VLFSVTGAIGESTRILMVTADVGRTQTLTEDEMQMDDDEVPELVTLDDHLSEELGRRLSGLSGGGPAAEEIAAEDSAGDKVPITILTGVCVCHRFLIGKVISGLGRRLY
jgi:hypothetical protein